MSNDLVKRLRDYEEYEQSRDGQIICVKSDMAQEAATYIEQLEAENRELAMQVLASGSQAQEAYEAQLKAEAATAAAYEVAAKVAKDGNFCFAFQMEKHIRALATPDQTAALDRLIAEAVEPLVEALTFYQGAWNYKINKRYGGLEWSPKEELLDDCGNKAKNAILAASKKGRK